MIPDEAVEAAAKVIPGPSEPYAQEIARAALEAAAPHMLAQAWDEAHFDGIGCDSTCCDFMHDAPKEDMNPYRPT